MRGIVITERFTNLTDTLDRYLADLRNEDLLTPDEEFQLFDKYKKENCERCKEKIIKANLRFVVSVAKQYQSKNVELEDLISEGNKGLIEASESFDPYMGFKFISYAVWSIRKYIHIYLSDLSRTVRIPAKITADMRKYSEMESDLSSKIGRIPTVEETLEYITETSDFTISQRSLDSIKNSPLSIPLDPQKPVGYSEESLSPIDVISNGDSADSIIINTERTEILKDLISYLSPIEKKVILMKFGLENGFPMGHREIGEYMGRSSEWSRSVARKAEKKLSILARKRKIENSI